ncbi:hypothetical protein [Mycobacteroides abscessus]|uniref:hypothetical protein n=1 Tax=Mycobacteroides abscessus TaxID=36809 RepID=UPI00092A9B80|nr:hypothetical protein [Mycobacteroides abscessus]DAZ90349.1 TPA_asm: tail terminator [Mycobacterium phage prophiFSQJ01-1]SII41399.1 Uncharacterised protein [Mycobacteroides abscessus subsp. abscessus]SIK13775.1 Uncharacterised protein [Mycobacteroides abscessus subsp. abscessus]SIN25618.1 Uncharacterised protein [Mycobacteroides abscessus subsp. abscessus]SLI51305.1 Uncharacterised protein [Mycobacteroides abscessus subsp. abscessus]
MAELIIAKPSVAIAVSALTAGLPQTGLSGVYVSSKKPGVATGHRVLPSKFIRVTRISPGGMLNRVTDLAHLLIECWADDGEGESLANAARGVLRASAGHTIASGFIRSFGNDSGPVDFPDPDVPSHDRYQFTGDLLISTN